MDGNIQRRYHMERLHIYPNGDVPKEFLENVTNQIKAPRIVPKRLDHYSEKDVKEFPKIIDYPTDYILRWLSCSFVEIKQ